MAGVEEPSGFKTIGAKTTNIYLSSIVKSMGEDFIREWVSKHKLTALSVTHLSVVVATNFAKNQEIDDDAKISLSKDLNPVVLKVLQEGSHVDLEQRQRLQKEIVGSPDMIDDFIVLTLELMDEQRLKEEEPKKLTKAEKRLIKRNRAARKKLEKRESKHKSKMTASSSDSDTDSVHHG
jgi:hypothetical protein